MHIPVLLEEVVKGLAVSPGAIYVDGTLGRGGHALALYKSVNKDLTIIGFDRDQEAIEVTEKHFKSLGMRYEFIHDSFRNIAQVLHEKKRVPVNAVLLDIGLSSPQFDTSSRGFTFRKDEPLLMTMERDVTPEMLTAKDIVNTFDEEALANIIYAYGEEKFARRIAHAIVERRRVHPLQTTNDLVSVVDAAVPSWYKRGKIHPATKTFQALRIAVNDELEALKEGIMGAFEVLAPGGRLAVITFHSLEDRITKHLFRSFVAEGKATLITKRPITPGTEELHHNPRARSAKLRIIQKN